jgi:glucosamine-6-phosphate deaminase
VLGLATGSTPLGLYRELARIHHEEGLDFSQNVTFNLDEYIGLPKDHPQSYHHFMSEHFFRHINLDPRNTHLPDGQASDVVEECQRYEALIEAAGGIDLQLLGIGRDGHLGFCEPGSSLSGRTSLVVLARETIDDNARFFRSIEEVPKYALSMGIGTVMEARRCLLLATGIGKAKAVRNAIEGALCSGCPASALQGHPDATVLLDEEAADLLDSRDHYLYVEQLLDAFEQGRVPVHVPHVVQDELMKLR